MTGGAAPAEGHHTDELGEMSFVNLGLGSRAAGVDLSPDDSPGMPDVAGRYAALLKQHKVPKTDSIPHQTAYVALHEHGSQWYGGTSQDWTCPAHEDDHASLGVLPEPGKIKPVVMKCLAGCGYDEIMTALDLNPRMLKSPRGKVVGGTKFGFADEEDRPLHAVVRLDFENGGKTFRQYPVDEEWNATTQGHDAMDGVRRVLYDLSGVLAHAGAGDEIVLTEGEKGALAVDEHGKFGTTASGGSSAKWSSDYVDALRGASLVTIIADRDASGYRYSAYVGGLLSTAGINHRIVQSATTGKGDDIVEHFEAGHGWDDLVPVTKAELDAEAMAADREAIEELKHSMRIRRQAERELAGEDFTDPGDDGSLDDQLADPAPEPEFVVGPSLIPRRGIVQVNAQWKAGKTTLVSVNLAGDLASGSPFLGEFPITFDSGNIGIWNLEVGAGTLQRWLFARNLPAEARRRIHPQHLRGRGVNISVPVWAEWAEGWLRDHDVKVWVIDPLSKLYTGKENDATEFNAWWLALEGIAHRAQVDLVILVHHTGHGTAGEGDALPRSRGTSAMQGNPDATYSYRHGGDLGSAPPAGDTRRYFGGFGRDVDVPEMTVDFDPVTKLLRCVRESRGRAADQTERNAHRVADVVWGASERLNTGDLKEALAPMKSEAKVAAIRRAVAEGWIAETKEGVAKWYSQGAVNPSAETMTFVVGGSGS